MAQFQDTTTGTIITFNLQHDIDSMRGHPNYIRLDDAKEEPLSEVKFNPPIPQFKKMGRPRKVQNV